MPITGNNSFYITRCFEAARRGSLFPATELALKYFFGFLGEYTINIPIIFLFWNYLMPGLVRLAHLPEIMYANLLWGIIISWKVNKHFAE